MWAPLAEVTRLMRLKKHTENETVTLLFEVGCSVWTLRIAMYLFDSPTKN